MEIPKTPEHDCPILSKEECLCDYIFLTGADLRRERRLAGRLASIKVVFSEHYEVPRYTESDVEKLYSEIEEDVNETILQEK